MSRKTCTAKQLLRLGSRMERSMRRRYSAISERSSLAGTPDDIEAWLMSLPPDSPASRSASQENGADLLTTAICGQPPVARLELSRQNGLCWKMSQVCLPGMEDYTSDEYSDNWPRWGTIWRGALYPLPTLAPRTYGAGCGLLPTPMASDTGTRFNRSPSRGAKKRPTAIQERFPTPQSADAKGRQNWSVDHGEKLTNLVGGSLNPDWVEWLMGWPIGQTACEPLGTDKFRQWLQQHGEFCLEHYGE